MMTIHFSDINIALERGATSDIEDAFRALVGWPNECEVIGADSRARIALLEPVCRALLDDERIMPGDTMAAIQEGREPLFGGQYRNGAGAVLADLGHWRRRLREAA